MSYQCNLSGMSWPVIKMLCAVISQVLSARGTLESEFSLDHVALHPVESHVHGLGALGGNGVVGDSRGGRIIGLGGRLPLGIFHFYASLEQGYNALGGDKNSS